MMDRSASRNRSADGRPPQDWFGRVVLYSLTQPSSAACSSVSVAYWPSAARKNSARIVLCSRSALPVVVGEYGLVSRCLMPLPAQIRWTGHSVFGLESHDHLRISDKTP